MLGLRTVIVLLMSEFIIYSALSFNKSEAFAEVTYSIPTLIDIRNAIINIRNEKIPNYKVFPNCGSFFKNSIIDKTQLEKLITQYPDMPYFETQDSKIKVYTGWLIEHVDYVSTQNDRVQFNEKNKLILVNTGNATFEDLENVIVSITKLVEESFGIILETEPNIFI